MNRSILVAAAIAVAAGGCGKRKSGKSAEACRAEAHALAELLGTIDRELPPFPEGDTRLVERADLPRRQLQVSPVIEVHADNRVTVRGEELPAELLLEERLRSLRAMTEDGGAQLRYARGDRPDPARVHLLIDERARWDTVVWVTRAAWTAGFDHPSFVFARQPAPVEPPPRSSVDDELDDIRESEDGSSKASRVAELTSRVVKPCPALGRAFGSVAEDGGDKAQTLIDAIEPALIECRCALDVPALASIMYRLLRVEHPVSAVDVVVAADGRAVSQPAATPWEDAYAQVTAGAPIHLAVAP